MFWRRFRIYHNQIDPRRSLDSFTVPLHNPNGGHLPLTLCKWTVSSSWNVLEIPTGHMNPQCNGTRGNPSLHLDQSFTKEWCQPIGYHVSQPTDSPIATRALIQYKMSSYRYRKSHCGDKTVVRSSYLHNGISYTGKMSSLYWIRAQVTTV